MAVSIALHIGICAHLPQAHHPCTSCGNSISLGQLDFIKVGEKCSRFVAYLFPLATDHLPRSSTTWTSFPLYVACVLRRSKFDTVVVIAAMVLLQRYSEVVGFAHVVHDSEVYRLFFASFIVASRSMNQPSNTLDFWYLIGGGIFSLQDVIDMVQELCRSFDWDIHVEVDILVRFVSILHEDAGLFGDKHAFYERLPSYDEIYRDIKIIGSPDFISQPYSILR